MGGDEIATRDTDMGSGFNPRPRMGGDWLLAMTLAYSHKKRFESVVRMYENNVDLVKKYEDVASDLREVVIMNTQTITRLVDRIDVGGK